MHTFGDLGFGLAHLYLLLPQSFFFTALKVILSHLKYRSYCIANLVQVVAMADLNIQPFVGYHWPAVACFDGLQQLARDNQHRVEVILCQKCQKLKNK